MIDYEKAKKIAQNRLNEDYSKKTYEVQIIEDVTIEEDFGWVFFYNTKDFITTGDVYHALGGNAPMIVTRKEGDIYFTGTAYPAKHYIEEFKKKYYKE